MEKWIGKEECVQRRNSSERRNRKEWRAQIVEQSTEGESDDMNLVNALEEGALLGN